MYQYSTILIASSPDDKPKLYGYSYLKKLEEYAISKGYKTIFLEDAYLYKFEDLLSRNYVKLLIVQGHGGAKGVAVKNGHVLLGVSDYDPDLGVKIYGSNPQLAYNKIVYLFTCNAMRELGYAMSKYAIAVAGFTKPFLFTIDEWATNPLDDKYAKPFFESAILFPKVLINGGSVGEAEELTRLSFRMYAKKEFGRIAKFLKYDEINFKVIGNKFAKLR